MPDFWALGTSLLQKPQAAKTLPVFPATEAGLSHRPYPLLLASAPGWAWLPGPQGRWVVRQEEALGGTAPHGTVRVQQQPWEAGCEVLDEAVGDVAECLPDLRRELPVVVLLEGGRERAPA